MKCIFCNIEKDKIILEGKYSIAFYDNYPVNLGHTLIIPKRHISDYFELYQYEKDDIWKLVEKMKTIIDKRYSPNGYNIGINIGEPAGQSVSHSHIHIIPRYIGDVSNPKGGVRGVIPNKQNY